MANETMAFVLITALFLTLLSLVMHLIRTTDEALVRRATAVAAVYLDAEAESSRRSATPWTARSGR